jgi:hypothetical protein
MYRIQYKKVCREMTDWLQVADSRSSDDAVSSVSSAECMQYARGCCAWFILHSMLTIDHGMQRYRGMVNFVFLGEGRVQVEKETDGGRWDKSSEESWN